MKTILCDKCKKQIGTDTEPIYFTVRFMNNRTLSDQNFEFCCGCRDKVYQNLIKFIELE